MLFNKLSYWLVYSSTISIQINTQIKWNWRLKSDSSLLHSYSNVHFPHKIELLQSETDRCYSRSRCVFYWLSHLQIYSHTPWSSHIVNARSWYCIFPLPLLPNTSAEHNMLWFHQPRIHGMAGILVFLSAPVLMPCSALDVAVMLQRERIKMMSFW